MKRIMILLAVAACFAACNTNYDIIDTGTANGRFDGSIYEYLKADSYNWDSVRLMIEKAELVDLFSGREPGYEDITFFGPTNHSVRRWLIKNHPDNINSWRPDGNKYLVISDLTKQQCYDLVMQHVLTERIMRDDFPRGRVEVDEFGYLLSANGGDTFEADLGNKIWICSMQGPYGGVAYTGAVILKIRPVDKNGNAGNIIDVASTNIEPDNGVVHALQYNYELGTFNKK